MNNSIRLNRLKELLYILENHKTLFKENFDIGHWYEVSNVTGDKSCGTSACALGSAACWPKFKKAGLKIVTDSYGHRSVTFKGFEDSKAGAEFFGIHTAEADWLFMPDTYGKVKKKDGTFVDLPYKDITALMVAKRVKLLISWYTKYKNTVMIDTEIGRYMDNTFSIYFLYGGPNSSTIQF